MPDLRDATLHYRAGRVMGRRESIRQRIFKRCEVRRGELGECWLWTGPTSGKGRGGGYGRAKLDGGTVAVHRVMFIIEYGPIPPRKQIDHKCRNRLCCNPDHLEMVTHKQNQKRRDQAVKRGE